MLQYICEESVLSKHTKVALHYLVRRNQQALFLNKLANVRHFLGNSFDGHLWITRQETAFPDQSVLSGGILTIHAHIASTPDQVGQPWEWWDCFSKHALKQFKTKDNRDKGLVYICGPQGLTDRLWEMYKESGMDFKTGHIQIEKWW
jgi:predicted ferric reductase